MALRDIESFESSAFTANGKWVPMFGIPARQLVAAKHGSYGIDNSYYATSYVFGGNEQTVIIGFWFNFVDGLTSRICRFYQSSTVQCTVGVNPANGAIQAWRGAEDAGGTLLGTSVDTGLVTAGVYHFVEVKVTISDSVGEMEIRIDRVTRLALSGVDTKVSANAYTTYVEIGKADGLKVKYFDSFYFCDNSGTLNNDFLGEGEARLLLPSSAGSSTQWTPSAGSNFQNVDDAAVHDSDTTYNETSTAGQKDLFAVGDVSVTGGSIAGVKLTTVMRKTDGGTREAAPIINLGGGESQRATETLSSSYVHYDEILEVDPVDATPLTEAKINAAEIGYILVT